MELKEARQMHLEAQRKKRNALKNEILKATKDKHMIAFDVHQLVGKNCSLSLVQVCMNELANEGKLVKEKIKQNNYTYWGYKATGESAEIQNGLIVSGNVTIHDMDLCESLHLKQSKFLRDQKRKTSVAIGSSFSMFGMVA